MNEEETIAFIARQIDLERRIIRLVEENTAELGNYFVKDLLLGIAHDSEKHAMLLGSLRALAEERTPLISEAQRDSIANGIDQHIRMEAEAIKTYTALIEGSENERVKTIAALIIEDETRHHKLLVDLHKAMGFPPNLTVVRILPSASQTLQGLCFLPSSTGSHGITLAASSGVRRWTPSTVESTSYESTPLSARRSFPTGSDTTRLGGLPHSWAVDSVDESTGGVYARKKPRRMRSGRFSFHGVYFAVCEPRLAGRRRSRRGTSASGYG